MRELQHIAATDGICKIDQTISRKTLARRAVKVNAGIVKKTLSSLDCKVEGRESDNSSHKKNPLALFSYTKTSGLSVTDCFVVASLRLPLRQPTGYRS